MDEKNSDINKDLARLLESTKGSKKESTKTNLAKLLESTKGSKKGKNELAHSDLVYRIISENQKWKNAQKGLTKDQFAKLNRMFQLKDYLEGQGVSYNFHSDTLPTVSRGNATDDLKRNDAIVNLLFVHANNQERWHAAEVILGKDAFNALVEMFDIIDELENQGIRYRITAGNDDTMYYPSMKRGKVDPNPVILL